MATFVVTNFADKNIYTEKDKNIYRAGIIKILDSLHLGLAGDAEIEELLDQAQHRAGIFNDQNINLELHPRLWSKTTRAGASNLRLPNTPAIETTTYEDLVRILEKKRSKLSFTNEEDAKKRDSINQALDQLENWQNDENKIYRRKLRHQTAEELIDILKNYAMSDELGKLLVSLGEIQNKNFEELETNDDALEYTKKINTLRNNLINYNKKYNKLFGENITPNFNQLSEQLSIITKRELDPIYAMPKKLTSKDKIRFALKGITAFTGMCCAALALAFIWNPVIAIPLGFISLVALYGLGDSVFELTRNLYYGRSPTKVQATEFAIVLPLLATLITGAHVVPVIASAITAKSAAISSAFSKAAATVGKGLGKVGTFFTGLGHTISTSAAKIGNAIGKASIAIAKGLQQYSNAINKYVLNTFGTVFNAFGATFNMVIADKFNHPKVVEQPALSNLRAGAALTKELAKQNFSSKTHINFVSTDHDLQDAMKRYHKEEATRAPGRSFKEFQNLNVKPNMAYLYHTKCENHIQTLHYSESYNHHIYNCKEGLFADNFSRKIINAINTYKALNDDTNVTIERRIISLEEILNTLKQHPEAETRKNIINLRAYVKHEIGLLKEMNVKINKFHKQPEEVLPVLVKK